MGHPHNVSEDNHVAQDVDARWSTAYDQGRDFTLANSQEISQFLGYVDPAAPRTVLDIGCGTGQLTRELYHRGFDAVGIDASTSAIHIAHSLTVVPHQQPTYIHLDIEQDDPSGLPHQPYGLITCKLVYAFIQDKLAFVTKVKQLLAPNGAFVVVTPLPEDMPPEKLGIAVSEQELELLTSEFKLVAKYKVRQLTYLVLRPK